MPVRCIHELAVPSHSQFGIGCAPGPGFTELPIITIVMDDHENQLKFLVIIPPFLRRLTSKASALHTEVSPLKRSCKSVFGGGKQSTL